jgi:hypothetical protein
MIKRNGEYCEHDVPNYPGHLTGSEFRAYNEILPLVADQLSSFQERATTLSEIEKKSAQIAAQINSNPVSRQFAAWDARYTLAKSPLSEMLLCSRGINGKEEFGIIERFAPESPYARVHGVSEVQMTSNNAFLLLRNYVEGERGVLQLFRQDVEATVEENLANKFPGQNHRRVVRAISARCAEQVPAENEKEQPARSIKIGMSGL